MTGPRVSVLIPTYNRAKLVQGAVASVLDQTFEDFEVLVVVDGSTDGTAKVLRAGFDDARVRLLEKENGGLASARNAGIAVARGAYVALLDDDDRCLPERLERQVRALEARPEATLCLSDARYEGRGVTPDRATLFAQPDYRTPDSLQAMFEGAWTLPSVMTFRTRVLKEVGFDASIRCQEDTDFLFRFHRAGHGVIALPDILVRYAAAAGEGEGRISEQRALMDEAYASIYTRNWDAATSEERGRVSRPVRVSRLLARYHTDRGELKRARACWFACWRARPWRIRLLLRSLRCLVPWGGAPR